MNATRIAPVALYQEVAERLRQRIFAHELPPGAWIDEQALAAQYGISRTPLREALKVLAAEGLVTLKPRRGCYVTEISDQDLDDVFAVLALLEGQSARAAVQHCGAAELAALQALHDRLEAAADAADLEGFFEANQAFHQALQNLAGNRWLAQLIADLRKVVKLSRHHSLQSAGRLQQSLAEHRELMEALRSGDPERVERSMNAHIHGGRAALAQIAAGQAA